MGSRIKLNVNIIKQACMRALKDFSDEVAKCREPIIQAKMKGTFGLFKLTREQAIDKLESEGCWREHHYYNIVPAVHKLLFLANNSQDEFLYMRREDLWIISSYIGECDGN